VLGFTPTLGPKWGCDKFGSSFKGPHSRFAHLFNQSLNKYLEFKGCVMSSWKKKDIIKNA
jgi:hypothetical protein